MNFCITSLKLTPSLLNKKNAFHFLISALVTFFLAGCTSLPSSGPSSAHIAEQKQEALPIPVIDVTDSVARHIVSAEKKGSFSEIWTNKEPPKYVVGRGDFLEVSIWEAPPAVLFSNSAITSMASSTPVFSNLQVDDEGKVRIPFIGQVVVAGKSVQQIEVDMVKRLLGKANQPQVLVRVTRNVTSNVTVVGEVAKSVRMPLTPKGERLLDAIADAGGAQHPVSKTTVQLSRTGTTAVMPLEAITQNPAQNIYLQPGDIITVLFKPLSFTVLGAAGKNAEIEFETQGITLAQALARSGGLIDSRADAQGVFIFRFEDPNALEMDRSALLMTPEKKIPVIYRMDLKDPRSFLVAQTFPVKNSDVIYIANAPAAELQKFLNILTSSIFSIDRLINLGD